VNIFVEISAL